MADAIIKFPGAAKNKQTTTADDIDRIFGEAAPQGTDSYPTMQVNSVPKKIDTKPDFATGTDRNPHWGLVLSLSLIPELSQAPVGPLMLPPTPSQFITADNLEDIRARVIFELDRAIAIATIAQKDPKAYQEYERAMMSRLMNAGSDVEQPV